MFAEIRGCSGSRLRWCSLMHSDFESVRIVMSLMMKFWVERGGLRFLDACTLSMCASFCQSNRILSLIVLPGIGPKIIIPCCICTLCLDSGRAERSVAPPPMANCYLFARYRYHFRSHGSYTLGKFFLYAEPIY